MLKKCLDLLGCQAGIFQLPEQREENKTEMQLPALLSLPAPCSCKVPADCAAIQ